jgi:hypothetical protein
MVIAFSARATYTDRRLQNNEWNDYKCLAIDKGRSLITNVLQLTRAARSWSELRAVRVLAVFCYLFGIGALLEREHTHRARVQPRSGMQIHIFRTLRRTPRVRSPALTPSPLEHEQMHTRAQTTSRAAIFRTAARRQINANKCH